MLYGTVMISAKKEC